MKTLLKMIIFFIGLFIIVEISSLLLMPNFSNFSEFGLYNKSKYEILDEKNNTVDVVFLGDSLIYSSISPMYIWNEFGYTSYDCAGPAYTIKDSYEYLKIAIKSQHPKIVFLESDVVFRSLHHDESFQNKVKDLKNYVPILKFHNNWKQLFSKNGYLNIYKGYKLNVTKNGYNGNIERNRNNKRKRIDTENMAYLNKIIKLCKRNNIEVVLISNPSKTGFKYDKHNQIELISKKKKIEFIDLNLVEIGIDWKNETKDNGKHLNYLGARKVSHYLGDYIKEKNIVNSHKDDKNYDSWNESYKVYYNKLFD